MPSKLPENQIIHLECVAGMRSLPSDFIHLTVTSPPYDDIRTYEGEWRFDFHAVAEQLLRITVPGGVLVWVVQEQIVDGQESLESSRQRLAFANLGWWMHHTMVGTARGGRSPNPTGKRYGYPLEYMMIFSKGGPPRYFNPLRDKVNTYAGQVGTFQNRGKDGSIQRVRRHKNAPYGLRKNVWEYVRGTASSKDQEAFEHPAIMPEKMAEDHIKTWSKVGDIVFDPFMGSGTTAKMAVLNYRRYLGFERVASYVEMARRRVAEAERQSRRQAG